MNTVRLMAEYASLADAHKATDTLVTLRIITRDEQFAAVSAEKGDTDA